eukprot:Skav204015  [mRNA]  locus=scaffold3441:105973:107701:- [translate_table: standard]
MLAGMRMAAERIKKENHQNKDDAKDSFAKAADELKGTTNSKDDIERAEKEAMEKSSDGSSSSDSSSSDSEKSSFGVASEKGTPSPKRAKRKSLTAAKAKAKTSSEKSRPKGNARKGTTIRVEVEKFNTALDASQKLLPMLMEIKADTLWRSCIRQHEVERRLARESSVTSTLQTAMEPDAIPSEERERASEVMEAIQLQCNFIRNMKEVCRSIRSFKSEDFIAQVKSPDASLTKLLSADDFSAGKGLASELSTLKDILHFVGKKLVDVNDTRCCQ